MSDTAPSPKIAPRADRAPHSSPRGHPPRAFLSTRFPRLSRLEAACAALLTLAAFGLRVLQAHDAGGLWRDEVVSVRVATMPTFGQLWRYLEFDSYPPLFHLLLRGWHATAGTGDSALRCLGLLIGTGILAAVWLTARALGCRAPLFALTLLGLSSVLIRFGDSMRAYGLGCALAVLTLAAVWRVAAAERVDARRAALAMVTGVLSVQCLYHNAVLLFAACVGGAVAAALAQRGKVALTVLSVGVPAAVSLLPYLPIIGRTRDWAMLAKYHSATFGWLWPVFSSAADVPFAPGGIFLWIALVVVAGGGVARQFLRHRLQRGVPADPALLRSVFALVTLGVAVVAYGVFLRVLDYSTQPWYYLPLLSVVAVCLDTVGGQAPGNLPWRSARLAMVLLLGGLLLGNAPEWPRLRSTNLDLIARVTNELAGPRDLVIANRWECAITMERYYHGAAPIISVPPLPDHAVHRYDLMKKALTATDDPLQPVLRAAETTLRRGGHVWLVAGQFWDLQREPVTAVPPLSPNLPGAWPVEEHVQAWAIQTADFLLRHAREAEVPVADWARLSLLERESFRCYSGWSDTVPPENAPR